jgi:uncharacterized membrane protein (DUF4010 family)
MGPPSLQADALIAAPLSESVVRLALAAMLGLFLGLEREWSEKSAGIRTFSLISLVGAVFTLVGESRPTLGVALVSVGGLLVVVQGVLLAVRGLRTGTGAESSLSLTTSVSMLAAYGVGVLVAEGFVFEGVTVAVVSSVLLVLKRELHSFAGDLSRPELRSMTEFAVLAFVVYPLLPAGRHTLFDVPLEPRVAWLMVVTVAGIGIANYLVVQFYGGRGVAVTGFLGGLVSSTAVVGTMLDHVSERSETVQYAAAAVVLADAAMALRNLFIAVAFTVTTPGRVLVGAVVPLGLLVLGGVGVGLLTTDWRAEVGLELESPFSLRNALGFGAAFLAILAVSGMAQTEFGTAGLYLSALVSGLVSSAGATTSAVLLYRSGSVGADAAVVAVLLATAASIAVKAGLAAAGPPAFGRRVAGYSVALLVVAGGATVAMAAVP